MSLIRRVKKEFLGKVISGDRLAGRDYDTPTANLDLPADIDLEYGVYAAITHHNGNRYHSTVCYGVGEPPKFEVHLFGFDGDILGNELRVEIVELVSELIPWQSIERMRQKILHDLEMAREIFKKRDL